MCILYSYYSIFCLPPCSSPSLSFSLPPPPPSGTLQRLTPATGSHSRRQRSLPMLSTNRRCFSWQSDSTSHTSLTRCDTHCTLTKSHFWYLLEKFDMWLTFVLYDGAGCILAQCTMQIRTSGFRFRVQFLLHAVTSASMNSWFLLLWCFSCAHFIALPFSWVAENVA